MVLNSHYTELFRWWLVVVVVSKLPIGREFKSFFWSSEKKLRKSEVCEREALEAAQRRQIWIQRRQIWIEWSAKRLRAVAAQRRQIWIEIGARSGSEALNVEDIRQTTQTTLSIKLSLDTNDQK